jgi:hypothetical protein
MAKINREMIKKDIPFESVIIGIKGEVLKEVASKGAG